MLRALLAWALGPYTAYPQLASLAVSDAIAESVAWEAQNPAKSRQVDNPLDI